MICSSCTTGIDHCHGTLVEHATGLVECTDSECVSLGIERHLLVIDCAEVAGGCACGEWLPGIVDPTVGSPMADGSADHHTAPVEELLRAS